MRGILTVEIIGIMTILGIQNIWIIDKREYIIGIVYLLSIIIVYFIVNKKWHKMGDIIKNIVFGNDLQNLKGKAYREELTHLAIYIGCFSLVGIPIVIGLCNWVFVTRDIITTSLMATASIIVFMLYIQVAIIIPLILLAKYKEARAIKKALVIDNI